MVASLLGKGHVPVYVYICFVCVSCVDSKSLRCCFGWTYTHDPQVRAERTVGLGPARLSLYGKGGAIVGDLPPYEAFPIGGTNSVRGYDEGAVGSGRNYVVASGEINVPLVSAPRRPSSPPACSPQIPCSWLTVSVVCEWADWCMNATC